jgi:hypothetical protein
MADIRELEDVKQRWPTHNEIAERAHEIYLRRGGDDGYDLDDWLAAEAELREERRKATESFRLKSRAATAGTFPSATKPDK